MTESDDLDAVDQTILDQLRETLTTMDPPPADLDERVRFAVALGSLEVEVARLQEDVLVGSGARGTERTRTITFDADSLTIMVAIVAAGAGHVRVDGWLAPAGRRRVELRIQGSPAPASPTSHVVTAEDTGRFVFDRVGHGLAQLLVHAETETGFDPAPIVATPPLML